MILFRIAAAAWREAGSRRCGHAHRAEGIERPVGDGGTGPSVESVVDAFGSAPEKTDGGDTGGR